MRVGSLRARAPSRPLLLCAPTLALSLAGVILRVASPDVSLFGLRGYGATLDGQPYLAGEKLLFSLQPAARRFLDH